MAGPTVPEEFLKAENAGLRMLLEQAGIDARVLLAQAGIDAEQRETADRLQKLILEELHHRIKNTLATVSAIASQSLRMAGTPSRAGFWHWAARTISCCRRDGRAPTLRTSSMVRPSPMTARARASFRFKAPISKLCPAR